MTAELLVKSTPTAPPTPIISDNQSISTETVISKNGKISTSPLTTQGSISDTPPDLKLTLPNTTLIGQPTAGLSSAMPTLPTPTITYSPQPALNNPIFYLKGGSGNGDGKELWWANPRGEDKKRMATGILEASVVSDNRVVILQISKNDGQWIVHLKLLNLANGVLSSEKVLDKQVFVLKGENLPQSSVMAISPDSNFVAYTKANLSYPPFSRFGSEINPVELWVVDLKNENPGPRILVPNPKDLIEDLHWSPDSNRLAFVRTFKNSTGAGYATEVWSVYKDGTRLSYLTGPDEGTYQGEKFSLFPASQFRWVGPLAFTFQSVDQLHLPLWIHDLGRSLDKARPLSLNSAPGSYQYCDGTRRYAFIKMDVKPGSSPKGLYTISVDEPGEGPALGKVFDPIARMLFDCQGSTILYLDGRAI